MNLQLQGQNTKWDQIIISFTQKWHILHKIVALPHTSLPHIEMEGKKYKHVNNWASHKHKQSISVCLVIALVPNVKGVLQIH